MPAQHKRFCTVHRYNSFKVNQEGGALRLAGFAITFPTKFDGLSTLVAIVLGS